MEFFQKIIMFILMILHLLFPFCFSDPNGGTTTETTTGIVEETTVDCAHYGGTATCTQKAVCLLCGEEYGETAEHSYTSKVTDPTCIAKGYTTYTCENCPKSYVVDYKNALGHDEIPHDGKEATCTQDGWAAYVTCSRCDYTTYEEISATGHSYSENVTAPTCTSGGYTTYTCTCGDTYTGNEVPALGHTEVTDVAVAATCTATGKTEGKHCSE